MTEAGYCSVDSGDLRLGVWVEGEPGAPVIVFVHGFPDTAALWERVVAELGERYRVVRYDVRGCGRSGRPRGRDGYRVERLAADLVAVARAVSPGRAVHVVGHDWGSVQAWEAVTDPTYSGVFASFTSVSGPSLDHLGWWVRGRCGGLRGMGFGGWRPSRCGRPTPGFSGPGLGSWWLLSSRGGSGCGAGMFGGGLSSTGRTCLGWCVRRRSGRPRCRCSWWCLGGIRS